MFCIKKISLRQERESQCYIVFFSPYYYLYLYSLSSTQHTQLVTIARASFKLAFFCQKVLLYQIIKQLSLGIIVIAIYQQRIDQQDRLIEGVDRTIDYFLIERTRIINTIMQREVSLLIIVQRPKLFAKPLRQFTGETYYLLKPLLG